jgi:TetR/AcrR family transcriptional regulator
MVESMRDTPSKNRILDTAARLFGEYGPDAVSTTLIAREAGINKAMIFYYFGSKDELYLAAVRKWVHELVTAIMGKIDEVEPGLPRIEALVRAHIGYLAEHPTLVKLIARELLTKTSDPNSPHMEIIRGFEEIRVMLRKSLFLSFELAKERGEIRPVDTVHTILNIISMDVFVFIGIPIIKVMIPEIDMQTIVNERADHVIDLLMNGLRPRTE